MKALQQDLGAPVSGGVNAATVREINAKLALFATDRRVVRGSVLDADGNPFANGFLQIFKAPAGQAIGKLPQ